MVRPLGSIRTALAASFAWAGAITAAAAGAMARITGWVDPHLTTILAIHFLGGLAAFVPATMTAGLIAAGKRAESRFCAAFVALAVGTLAATAFVYGLQHLRHDIDWSGFPGPEFHYMDIPGSLLESLFYYLFLGARLLAPEGLVPLLLASLWIARRLR